MLKELIKLANDLDSKGLTKEADGLDRIIKTAWGFGWFEGLEAKTIIEGKNGEPDAVDIQDFKNEIFDDMEQHLKALDEIKSGANPMRSSERQWKREVNNIREYYMDLYSKVSSRWHGFRFQEDALAIVRETMGKFPSPEGDDRDEARETIDGSKLGELVARKSRLEQELSSARAELDGIRRALTRIAAKYGYRATVHLPGDNDRYSGRPTSGNGFIAFGGDIMNPEGLIQDLSRIGITAQQESGHAFSLIIDSPAVD